VIFVTRLAFVVVGSGTFHTLASYRSRHTGPATTASGPHVFAALAVLVTSATARETIITFRIIVVALLALRRRAGWNADTATPVPDARKRPTSAANASDKKGWPA
jgi:hypothetical protein